METLDEVLAHYGIRGMKWGVRRGRNVASTHPPSEDAARASAAKAKAKASGGTHTLSNKEIQDIVTRMNLERQYSQLNPKSNPAKKGQAFVKEGLAVFGTAAALHSALKSPLAKDVAIALKKK